ncbi:hypothetical protein KFL_009370010, partial [Klebsormidium nitens]
VTRLSMVGASKMQLGQELHSFKIKSGEPVTMYVGQANDLYGNLVANRSEMKPDELAWTVLVGLPKTFGTVRRIVEALKSAISSVDATLPTLLVHKQGFEESPKAKGRRSDSALAYVAGRIANKETCHGKDESRGKRPQMLPFGSHCPEVQQGREAGTQAGAKKGGDSSFSPMMDNAFFD